MLNKFKVTIVDHEGATCIKEASGVIFQTGLVIVRVDREVLPTEGSLAQLTKVVRDEVAFFNPIYVKSEEID